MQVIEVKWRDKVNIRCASCHKKFQGGYGIEGTTLFLCKDCAYPVHELEWGR